MHSLIELVRYGKNGEIQMMVETPRGERLTPTHAVKKGTRYRYYVSKAVGSFENIRDTEFSCSSFNDVTTPTRDTSN
jgi:hypothetical protein